MCYNICEKKQIIRSNIDIKKYIERRFIMLLFSGGFTKKQVNILKSGDKLLYNKVPYEIACAKGNNTFNYVPKHLENLPLEKFREYVSEDCYKNQYIFFAKYLKASLEFCINREKKNYILVCDLDNELIESYVGVGDYKDGDYRIEYRIPAEVIKPQSIIDVLYYEPYDLDQENKMYNKYINNFFVPNNETEKAKELIKRKKLVFNRDKWK